MNNTAKLESLGILGDIRKRLGAEDEYDISQDTKINNMTPHQLVKEWCAWQLGDGTWWTQMKHYFDVLKD